MFRILLYIGLFVIYIVVHYAIGRKRDDLKAQLEATGTDEPSYLGLEADTKKFVKLFKFFPMIYVVLAVIIILLV